MSMTMERYKALMWEPGASYQAAPSADDAQQAKPFSSTRETETGKDWRDAAGQEAERDGGRGREQERDREMNTPGE